MEFVIDFDADPAGNSIADGTRLDGPDNPYACWGVSFTALQSQGVAHVWARASYYSVSTPNLVTLQHAPAWAGDADASGKIRIDFDIPVSLVSIDAKVVTPLEMCGRPGPGALLEAYDRAGFLLQSAIFALTRVPQTTGELSVAQTLVVASPGIAYVLMSCPSDPLGNSLTAFFDNFIFNRIG
ncbi:MAG TPA: hypothetical protein VGD63_07690 [Steroidobacteraceae bacterium]